MRPHLDRTHHAAVLVLQNVTVIWECADDVGIAKVHTQSYAGVYPSKSIPIWNVDRVAERKFFICTTRTPNHQEMGLMDVKGVRLVGSVFDNPILDVPGFNSDIRGVG